MQLVSNPKVNQPEPLSLQVVCNQGKHSLWLKQVTDMYEYYSSHDKGTVPFVVYNTYLMPK